MPESVTDRPTKAHEYIFLLAKQPRYFYDSEAIREPSVEQDWQSRYDRVAQKHKNAFPTGIRSRDNFQRDTKEDQVPGQLLQHRLDREPTFATGYRNKRDVWEVVSSPFSGAHFATFPPDLIKPCVLAGTSEYGVCSECGAPWMREMTRPFVGSYHDHTENLTQGYRQNGKGPKSVSVYPVPQFLGWKPTCKHADASRVPATVLDPFVGSGTACAVAQEFGRKSIGIDISSAYLDLAIKRISAVPIPMEF